MTITRIHGSNIATQWQEILTDYAYLSDDSDSSRGISQIAPEEIVQFLGRKEKILRKNQLKLRKNQIISPKNFFVPRWKMSSS